MFVCDKTLVDFVCHCACILIQQWHNVGEMLKYTHEEVVLSTKRMHYFDNEEWSEKQITR